MYLGIKGSSALGIDIAFYSAGIDCMQAGGVVYTLGVEGRSQNLCSPVLCLQNFMMWERQRRN